MHLIGAGDAAQQVAAEASHPIDQEPVPRAPPLFHEGSKAELRGQLYG